MSVNVDSDRFCKIAHFLYLCRKMNVKFISFLFFLPIPIIIALSIESNKYEFWRFVPLLLWWFAFSFSQFLSSYDSYLFLKNFISLESELDSMSIYPNLVCVQRLLKCQMFFSILFPPVFIILFCVVYSKTRFLKKFYKSNCDEEDSGFDIENHLPQNIGVSE